MVMPVSHSIFDLVVFEAKLELRVSSANGNSGEKNLLFMHSLKFSSLWLGIIKFGSFHYIKHSLTDKLTKG
jgi:hypothetical protein